MEWISQNPRYNNRSKHIGPLAGLFSFQKLTTKSFSDMDISDNGRVFPKSGYFTHILSDFGNTLLTDVGRPNIQSRQGWRPLNYNFVRNSSSVIPACPSMLCNVPFATSIMIRNDDSSHTQKSIFAELYMTPLLRNNSETKTNQNHYDFIWF